MRVEVRGQLAVVGSRLLQGSPENETIKFGLKHLYWLILMAHFLNPSPPLFFNIFAF